MVACLCLCLGPLKGLAFVQLIGATRLVDPMRLEVIKAILGQLPAPNLRMLEFLLKHLQRVVQHKEFNRMQVTNVALIFGPTLIRPAVETPVTMVRGPLGVGVGGVVYVCVYVRGGGRYGPCAVSRGLMGVARLVRS